MAKIASRGFSLLELLVVVVIIGILASMFTLSVGLSGGDRDLEREADRMQALLELASEDAVFQGRELGLRFYPDGYEFSQLDPNENEWRVMGNDPLLRENFIERVFAYRRLRRLFNGRWALGQLVKFHANEKLLLMAHSQQKALGQLVARAKHVARTELRDEYQRLFLAAMARRSTVRKHTNVLQHILGFFKKELDADSRHELLAHIEDYRRGLVPLVVPLTLIRHYVRILHVPYLEDQVYLNPHPKELALRNHV